MYSAKLIWKIIVLGVFACAVNLSGEEKNAPASIDQLLLERARQGEVQAQLEAGFAFYRLNNPVRAAYWFSQAARQGSAPAQYNMGRCCLAGYGVEKNLHQAFEYFKSAAAAGLPPAQLAAAELYLSGIAAVPEHNPPLPETAPDEKAAFTLLEKAVAQNYIPARIVYAAYLIKKYRNKEPQKIITLLNGAIDKGDLPSCVMLADFLLNRTDDLRDEKRARSLLEKAAPVIPEAMAKLAFAVEKGYGSPPEPEKAFELYRKALDKTFVPLAASRLANYYIAGRSGVKQDIPQALELYKKSAAAGVVESITMLGVCSKHGIGMAADPEKAFELFFQAAKADHAPAQYELGECFANGIGTAPDQQGAFYWFNQSAMRYEPRALLEVGKRYLQGNGTTPDAAKAAAYLEQAYANGMTEAAGLLQTARHKMQSENSVLPQTLPDFGL